MMNNILEFNATEQEEIIAKRSAEAIHDSIYFSYNIPLQIRIYKKCDNDGNETDILTGVITNYMPRKNSCCELTFSELFGTDMPKKEDLKDFCNTTISILKNLIRQFESFRDGNTDMVYYPNCEDSKEDKDELLNPLGK